jgi:hypothetical protein
MIFFNRELVQDEDISVTMVSNSTTEVHNKIIHICRSFYHI